LHELSETFDNHVLDSQEKFQWKTSELADLAGVPAHIIANAKQDDGSYQLSIDQPTYFGIITYAQNRDLRRTFFKAYNTRASDKSHYDNQQFDNTPVIQEILKLRQELASIIGMQDYLAYSLSSKMAKNKKIKSFTSQPHQIFFLLIFLI
jgi:oligopeptidase A